MHSEWFHIPEDTITAIRAATNKQFETVCGPQSATDDIPDGSCPRSFPHVARVLHGGPPSSATRPEKNLAGSGGRRIVALGTTVARTLEYYAQTGKTEGEDDIFIYPGYEFKIVDALITNFHAPKSTVLMLASAFAGWGHLKSAYDHAIAEKYNFLSYGDSMLIC
ncbi:S-adenosylmethionine:tRNA ribosyltransferase-isomerase [Candidatus Saccharibacteria bacterium]|nr:S-adenosylmethionine:tRNA ribosyltransferase-isomerase [Candidatus Saccharibacteria bacterium]